MPILFVYLMSLSYRAGPAPDTLLTFVASAPNDAQSELQHRDKRRRLTTTSELAAVEAREVSSRVPDAFVNIFKRRLDFVSWVVLPLVGL